MRVTRRSLAAVLISVGLHVLAAGGIIAASLWGAWPRQPTDIEITGMRMEDLQDLPLGLPASGDKQPEAEIAPPPRAPRRRPPDKDTDGDQAKADREPGRDVASSNPDGGAAPPRPTSVRSYAPEGSRVTALLRVDRLRGSSYAAVVDALLMNLPDRRDLLEGTGVEFYRDIDAVLIATPNPLDPVVTFLVARHRLSDAGLRTALEKGARATGRKLTWRTERGRPFAERRAAGAGVADGGDADARDRPGNRDRRLILLPAPKLVVVAPPAYRSLILRGGAVVAKRGQSQNAGGGGGGGGGAAGGTGADGGAPQSDGGGQSADALGTSGAPAVDAADSSGWAMLLRRIDAEDSVMPPDGVAMVSAVDLFSARSLRSTLDRVPGTRGTVDEDARAGATIMGLPVPRMLTATLGVRPQPFADVDCEFSEESDAVRWELEWPKLRQRLLSNPLVVLSGFAGLISRATITRAGVTVHLRIDATELETTTLLELAASQLANLRR